MIGKAVLRSILEDIRDNSGFFGLIADESRDISNKEQLRTAPYPLCLPQIGFGINRLCK